MITTIENIPDELFKVINIDDNSQYPDLIEHLKSRNFDGNTYTLERILTNRKRKKWVIQCFKAENHDTFIKTI